MECQMYSFPVCIRRLMAFHGVCEFRAKISIPTIHHSFASEKQNGKMHLIGVARTGLSTLIHLLTRGLTN